MIMITSKPMMMLSDDGVAPAGPEIRNVALARATALFSYRPGRASDTRTANIESIEHARNEKCCPHCSHSMVFVSTSFLC